MRRRSGRALPAGAFTSAYRTPPTQLRMTHARTRIAFALATLGLGALTAAGCGNSVPAGSVAKVGDATITKQEFDKWLKTAATGQAQGGAASVPDPPTFRKCIDAKQKQPQLGGGRPSESQLRTQCRQEYDQLKGEVMQFLIQAEWVQQEAEEQGVRVSEAEVRRSFEDQKKQAFPKEKGYRDFLRTSGMTEQDILFRVRLDTLQQKLTQKVTERSSRVTDQDVRRYYEKNKRRFAQPERRNLNVVLTRNEARARRARAALRRGQSWRSVARRYSIDEASKSQGGKLPDVTRGQQERALDRAVFRARRGQTVGPVKTQFGWYLFEVTKVTPATQQSLRQASATIKNLLRSQRQQRALDRFIKDFRKEYKEKTSCADGFTVAECKNAPKEKTDTGPGAAGGAPGAQGGQPPQGAPPPQGTPAPQGEPPAPQPPQGAPPQGVPPQGAPPQGAPPQGAPPQGAPPQGAPPQGAPPQP